MKLFSITIGYKMIVLHIENLFYYLNIKENKKNILLEKSLEPTYLVVLIIYRYKAYMCTYQQFCNTTTDMALIVEI